MSEARLPLLLQEIADAAGVAAALELARRWGGQRVYIPKAARDDHWLTTAVGREAAKAISNLYGGEYLTLPIGPAGALQQARRSAEAAIAEGASANEAARRSGFTTRTIYARRARREREKASGQGRLFDD